MSVTNPTKEEAQTFCDHCEWVCRCWSMNLAIFKCLDLEAQSKLTKEQFERGNLEQTPMERLLNDYLFMSNYYTLLETAKLHDPEVALQGNINLSIAFFVERTSWTDEERERVKSIKAKLNRFCECHKIKTLRNKFIAHHDRETFETLRTEVIQHIPPCEIDNYLENLGKLANEIWKKWGFETTNGSRDFDWSPSGSFRRGHQKEAEAVIACILAGHKAQTPPASGSFGGQA